MGYYTNQAGSYEAVLGMNAQYNLSGDGDQQLVGGLYFRLGDAVIPMVGFIYKNIRLLFTYDVTVSSLGKYNGNRGAWEFAFIQNGSYTQYNGNRRESLCPSFQQ